MGIYINYPLNTAYSLQCVSKKCLKRCFFGAFDEKGKKTIYQIAILDVVICF